MLDKVMPLLSTWNLYAYCLFVSRAVSLVRAEVSTVNKRKIEIRMERVGEEAEKKEKVRKNVANCKRVKG